MRSVNLKNVSLCFFPVKVIGVQITFLRLPSSVASPKPRNFLKSRSRAGTELTNDMNMSDEEKSLASDGKDKANTSSPQNGSSDARDGEARLRKRCYKVLSSLRQ